MISISKNVHTYKLHDIIKEYINAYYSTIKMKPVDVKSTTYIDPKFEVGDHVGI